jgi:hypothetical protein
MTLTIADYMTNHRGGAKTPATESASTGYPVDVMQTIENYITKAGGAATIAAEFPTNLDIVLVARLIRDTGVVK